MAAQVFQSRQVATGLPPITACGADDLVAAQAVFTVTEALEINDVFDLIVLPAGHKLVDAILDVTDLDTGGSPALTLSVGTLAGTPGDTVLANRTASENVIAASTVGQAGGVARAAVAGFTDIAPQDTDRSIGVLCKAAPQTGATSGTIRLTVFYRAQVFGN